MNQVILPEALRHIPDPPEALYIRGTFPVTAHYICIVGARRMSPYGKDMCERIIQGLAGHSITIVSGLALGIDAQAHTCALQAKLPTIAFPGSGLDDEVLYPRANLALARHIIDSGGALISEYPSNTISRPYTFPRRNRLMAGLCELVIVIECTKDSGSLITAHLALDYNKQIGAVPGSSFSQNSQGPHYLLRQGAHIIENSQDVLRVLGIDTSNPLVQESLFKDIPSDEHKIVELLAFPHTRASLCEKMAEQYQWSISESQIILARMEIKGIIEERLGEIRLKR